MKQIAIVSACSILLGVLTGCSTTSFEQESSSPSRGFSELRANGTYFGELTTRNGSRRTGFVTWEPQHDRFIIRVYRPTAVSLKMPSREITRIRFRDLTEEESKMIEDQNKPVEAIRR